MKILCLFIIVTILLLVHPDNTYATNQSSLVLNRVMINPTSCSDFDCEWIELKNIGSEQINLSDYKYNGTIMMPFILLPQQRVIIAKELIDGSDADIESFEYRWGDNSGIWSDSLLETVNAIDDSAIGISINLSNTTGSISLDRVDQTHSLSFSWDDSNIAYYFKNNKFYGFNDESLISIDWLNDTVFPVIIININDFTIDNNSSIQMTANNLKFDINKSYDNSYIVDFYSSITKDGNQVITTSDIRFEYSFVEIGDYKIQFQIKDLNDNVSVEDIYINVRDVFDDIYINEIYTGSGEKNAWVEIFSNNDFDISLSEYSIEYNGKQDIFGSASIGPGKSYFVHDINESITPDQCVNLYFLKTLIDNFCIEEQVVDKSYNKDTEGNYEALPTKGFVNISKNAIKENEIEKIYEIEDIHDLLIDSKIKVRGIVNSNTNLFNKDFIYLQNNNLSIKVKIEDFDYLFKFGDNLIVEGMLIKDNQSKYNIKADNIDLINSDNIITTRGITNDMLTLDYEGRLVNISGIIEKSSGNEFYIVGFDKLKVVLLDEWEITKQKGDRVSITGVLSYYKYRGEIKYSLYPTNKDSVLINDSIDNNSNNASVLSADDQNTNEETLANAGGVHYLFNFLFAVLVILLAFISYARSRSAFICCGSSRSVS